MNKFFALSRFSKNRERIIYSSQRFTMLSNDSSTLGCEYKTTGPFSKDEQLRSQYVRSLILRNDERCIARDFALPPRVIVQFWDNVDTIPGDVRQCLESWQKLKKQRFEYLLFNDESAVAYIRDHFDDMHVCAFRRCRHPAMRSDYFRLCFIAKTGGCYIDADDVLLGSNLEQRLFNNSKLKLQPLCYSASADSMVNIADSLLNTENLRNLIFYVNNNPIIAPPNHPIIKLALKRSTHSILAQKQDAKQDIQSITGPGNLTICLMGHAMQLDRTGKDQDFEFLVNWSTTSVSKWPLGYRNDCRNWRLWDGS